jgi:acetyl-CoA carboxylase carboxyl transferase subunit alpha
LGIGVANRVLILENAYYSVISPEGCASILWKDRAFAPQAAEALRISSKDLLQLGLVDEVIPEPTGGAHRDWKTTISNTMDRIRHHLAELIQLPQSRLIETRHARFRAIGTIQEP